MKKILQSLILIVIGIVIGVVATIELFAIDVDLLGVPYANKPVIATQDLVATQGDTEILIPEGTVLRFKYYAKEAPFYSLPISGEPFADLPLEDTDQIAHFYLKSPEPTTEDKEAN